MSWRTVPVCNRHWLVEEGDRQPYRTKNQPSDPCYRCGRPSNIYVRRDVITSLPEGQRASNNINPMKGMSC